MRIAHISDLHFSKFSFGPVQFFSKRWLGNANFLLNRSQSSSNTRPFSLIEPFTSLKITHVVITGDLTTTSHPKEYEMAKRFIEALKEKGMKVFVIPGNHDHYTKRAGRNKVFYRYFDPLFTPSPFTLKEHGVTASPLSNGWTLIALDTTLATPLTSSNGLFSEATEEHLKNLLRQIPPRAEDHPCQSLPVFST